MIKPLDKLKLPSNGQMVNNLFVIAEQRLPVGIWQPYWIADIIGALALYAFGFTRCYLRAHESTMLDMPYVSR